MSKLSFRARALDPSKQMPIYLAEELPDLPEYSAINRAVPQMPSGMEKEEESEHHLQRAICTGLIIPTPEVYTTEQDFYDRNYPPNYRMPRQLIHMQPLGLEQDVPEYDMDSEDELWINQQRKRLDLTPLKFEQMMDRLEKSSGQTVVTLNEAKSLLKQDDEISIAVYDYWLNKRLKMQHPLILSVKTENRPGASSNNPYLAFRRRTEKMQTRKNRKNDETSYEKMLKLRRDLQRATTVLEMVKRREKTKREQLHLSIEIFEKRVQLRDYNGALLSELSATLKSSRPAFAPLYANQYSHHSSSSGATPTAVVPSVGSSAAGLNNVMGSSGLLTPGATGTTPGGHLYSSASQYLSSANIAMDAINTAGNRKEKRQYRKRKHKPRDKQQLHHQQHHQQHLQQQQQYLANIGVIPTSATNVAAMGAGIAGGVGVGSGTLSHHLPPHLQHHLHRQSSSPAPNESTIETEEEDLAHKMGSESEEEAPFAFRRKQGCDYLRSRSHTGNWAWEPKEDCGFGDTKYRYTLTSIRHPRPRCIGFARRRMGRGGRVLLDRLATNFDEFWSQLDYTILESKNLQTTASVDTCDLTTTTNKKDLTPKPASPPTVVDLVTSATAVSAAVEALSTLATSTTVNNVNSPAITIKKEVIDSTTHLLDHTDNADDANEIDDLENGSHNRLEYEYSDEEVEDEDGMYIQRDRDYHSCISMARRIRRRRQQLNQSENSKRRKLNSQFAKQKSLDLAQRRLLYKLSQSLMEEGGNHGREDNCIKSFTSAEEVKQEKVNGINKDEALTKSSSSVNAWTNHRCSVSQSVEQNKANANSIYNSSSSSTSSSVAGIIVNNNNSSSNVNKNISNGSRSMNSCSISDKTNVIKSELEVHDADFENASTSSCTQGDLQSRVIKQELIDSSAPSNASADDSNEPLSSMQKMKSQSQVTPPDIVEDEENVNLAQLSNLIKIKKEVYEESTDKMEVDLMQSNGGQRQFRSSSNEKHASDDDDDLPCFNQMPDVLRLKNMKRERYLPSPKALKGVNILIEDVANDTNEEEELSMMGGLSPTSSQRLDICNELLSEIRRDWLHFRPKTPTETEKDDFWSLDLDYKLSCPLVEWSQQTPIAVEMVREDLTDNGFRERMPSIKKPSVWKNDLDDQQSAFITPAFKYEDMEADTQLLQNSFMSDITRGSSKSPEGNNSAGCLDLNFSGDSLNDINLLGDGDDADMLDNILQEVQIDDIKTLNQATNFWNGILDGENVDAEVDGDVEAAAGLLDGIDDATKKGDKSLAEVKKTTKAKGGKKLCALLAPVGSSSFNCSPLETSTVKDDKFFSKEEETKIEPCVDETTELEEVAIKIEPIETSETKPVASRANNALLNVGQQQQHQLPPPASLVLSPSSSTPSVNINSQRDVLQIGPAAPIVLAPNMSQQQTHIQTTHQTQHVITSHPTPSLQVIGNAITINHSNEPISTQNQLQNVTPLATGNTQQTPQQPQQVSQQLTTIQVLQQPTTQRIRNVTVQELHQLQQQQQRKLQQQKFLMQRDLVNTTSGPSNSASTVIAQYVPNSNNSTTIMRQPTLTPIGASSVNNSTGQMIYTTTASGDVIATGSQKIYLQKAPVSLSSATQGVNIISTSSGQQLTVQNIAGVQHINPGGNGSNTAGPLIVTTSARNAVQQLAQQHQQQQLVAQPTQQIVWRQIGSTNVTTTPAGMLSATTNADGTVTATTGTGNKIVWTNRPAQKRQLNGPENTDINKLLLNRKFSQRKIITQQQQAQPQILQQQLQHQQQQQGQDDDLTAVNAARGGVQDVTSTTTTTTGVAVYGTQQQQQQQQQQQPQIQKVAGGKVIKMPSFPLLVSEVNLQQQQQQQHQLQQQKHNTAAAIAANHNYSLQPIITTSQASQQASAGGNKIYLTTSSSAGAATNFTITNASELQSAAQKLQQANNTNLKLNFVAAATNASNHQPGGGVTMQQQQQTLVLNKATMQQQHLLSQQLLQQGKLKRERILNIIGATTTIDATAGTVTATTVGGTTITGDNNKRVLYTSLLNVKQLQKNNAGQMQVQIGPQGMAHAVLRSRIGNNQAIFANMRTVPVTTVSGHNNTGGTTGTTVQVVSSSQASVNVNSNTIPASVGGGGSNVVMSASDVASGQQEMSTTGTSDINNSVGMMTIANSSTNDLKSASGMENSTIVTSSPGVVSTTNSSTNGGGNSNNITTNNNNNVTTINNTTTINR